MLRGLLRALLAATALAPVLLTWAYVRVRESGALVDAAVPVCSAIALVVVCRVLIGAAVKYLSNLTPFHAQTVKASDNELVTFVLAYLFPLVGLSDANVDVLAVGFAIGLLLVIVMSTHAYQTNPLLSLFGYHFYEVESTNGVTYFILSKQVIRNASDIRTVKQIAPFVLLDATR